MAPGPDPDGPVERPQAWLPPAASGRPSPPAVPPPVPPPVSPPPAGPGYSGLPPGYRPVGPPPALRSQTTAIRLLVVGVVVIVLAVALVTALAISFIRGTGGSGQPPTSLPSSGPSGVTAVWQVSPKELRPDLGDAKFLGSLDGDFTDSYLAAEAGVWLTVTGTEDATDTAVHALDPTTGEVRWTRPLDGVLCATEATKAGILCASVLERDRSTGLGTRWRLHLLDPSTGQDRRHRDIDGWLTAVHAADGTFVVVEQRQPAPHAVLRAFGASDLAPRWTVDLADRKGQSEMFSENREINRSEPDRPGLALDRPRIRDVGSGLVALWAGQVTAFVDVDSGRLVMMPHCSRLVDDGKRLWCNEVDGATAYSYDGRRLVRVRGPRLAFSIDDGVGIDRNRAVFLDKTGAAVTVDPATGRVGSTYTPPGVGSAFGSVILPQAATLGRHTFLIGKAGTMLLESDRDQVAWRNPEIKFSFQPIIRGRTVLLGDFTWDVVDLRTGTETGGQIRSGTLYLISVGDQLVGDGPDLITLLRT